ncbi:hypothetical protein PAHAL_6G093000 [Panicum hallii]|uniref:Piwi domain-containing protein n=1 Tax=Panicum hallii TaxID=206008 RepID=A0A2T8IFT2_9POAL|nr:uncharacterized protein LOC112897580 [Panicum hallii]PVH36527.1 hypothetical protein PAHAL_6G093000 [Panicum hallii]
MRNRDSQNVVSSSDEMIEDGDSAEDMGDADSDIGDEDMGDADSDIIYLEEFRSPDETESKDDEEELDDDEFEAHNYNQSLEAPDKDKKAGGVEEKWPEAKHTTRDIVDILDDDYDLQVEHGLVTRWALLNYSSLTNIRSRRFLAKLQYTCLSLGMAKFATWPKREFRETVGLVAIEELLDVLKIELVLLIPPFLGYNDAIFFNSFHKKNKEWPKRLFFFRNGLEEGEFGHICQQEIDAIKQACASFDVSVTYVVVMQIHGTKLHSAMCKYKFLCRHTTEEISNVVYYCVAHDDNHFPTGELQVLTSQLCTFRHHRKNPYSGTDVLHFQEYCRRIEKMRTSKNGEMRMTTLL